MTVSDPDWFNAHPRRRHRVRPIRLAELLEGVRRDAPQGCTKLAAVRRVAPLKLMTVYLVDCAATAYDNLDEASAYEFFEYALSMAPPRRRNCAPRPRGIGHEQVHVSEMPGVASTPAFRSKRIKRGNAPMNRHARRAAEAKLRRQRRETDDTQQVVQGSDIDPKGPSQRGIMPL